MVLERKVDMAQCLLIGEEGSESLRLRQLLDGLGIDTSQTALPEEALKYCNDNAPDVVMVSASSKLARPKDFVRKLSRIVRGKKPVIFMLAETPDTEMIGRSILQGAADVLMKPFDREILQFKLRQAGILA